MRAFAHIPSHSSHFALHPAFHTPTRAQCPENELDPEQTAMLGRTMTTTCTFKPWPCDAPWETIRKHPFGGLLNLVAAARSGPVLGTKAIEAVFGRQGAVTGTLCNAHLVLEWKRDGEDVEEPELGCGIAGFEPTSKEELVALKSISCTGSGGFLMYAPLKKRIIAYHRLDEGKCSPEDVAAGGDYYLG